MRGADRFQVCAWSGSVYHSTSWQFCTPSETKWWIARRSGSGIGVESMAAR
ncbi:hypothetical protein ACFYYR_31205 [Streptomyces sp. NPDC001922]|uniref:hypothetical protein n=1 Tax=Streptomyces sp. NPDC001922 TaxID=3364624 RepID=UPI0036A75B3E